MLGYKGEKIMPRFEYITCNRNLEESGEEFIKKINKLGEKKWEAVCSLSSLLSNFEQILLKREKGPWNL